jgi:hypothetical protein
MRYVLAGAITALMILAPASAAPSRDFHSREGVLAWINDYRHKPNVRIVPAAVQAMSKLGLLREPESSGVYVGFIAGVIATQRKPDELIAKFFPIPHDDSWAIVRAIAYSGHPEWKELLQRVGSRIPRRQVMIEKYQTGKLPTLAELTAEKQSPPWYKRMGDYARIDKMFSEEEPRKDTTLENSPELLDTLWGYYFATRSVTQIARIITLLPGAKDRNDLEKLVLGSMAKYTLAMNAARDGELLDLLKRSRTQQKKEVLVELDDVIDAAETMDTPRLRKEAHAAVEDLKRKGPNYKRKVAWWGHVGEGALALGCIGAAVAGQVQFGIPCVVGGAVGSAALKFWARE